MPPKRSHDNVDVDVDDEGEGDNIKTIWIDSPNGEQFMCEICSSILKSAASPLCLLIQKGFDKKLGTFLWDTLYIYFIIRHFIITPKFSGFIP